MRVARRTVVLLIVASLVQVGAAGCFRRAFPTKSQYVIDTARGAAPRRQGTSVLRLSHVGAATQYDRKSFVYRTGELTFADDFYNTFYVPPTRMVSSILARWLEDSGLFSAVVDASSLASPDWTMEVRITDLYVDQRDKGDPAAVVGIEVTLLAAGRTTLQAVLERRYVETEPASARNGDAYVAAWGTALSRALSRLEEDLAGVVVR